MANHEFYSSILDEEAQLSCNGSMNIKLIGVDRPFYCPLCGEEVTKES